jgi:hypothetical protein
MSFEGLISKDIIKEEVIEPTCIDGYNYKRRIDPEHLEDYKKGVYELTKHFDELLADFLGTNINPPFSSDDFIDYVESRYGFKVDVYGFDRRHHETAKGLFQWQSFEKTELGIWVNVDFPAETQQTTVIHEAIHALQDYDPCFHEKLSKFPESIQLRLAERVAEKTAINIRLPKEMVEKDKMQGLNIFAIACKYGVSLEMASYA